MSYTLDKTGAQIDVILERAEEGGAIDQAIAAKQDALTFDAAPTDGSTNPVTSGGVYDALVEKAPIASPTFTGNVTVGGKLTLGANGTNANDAVTKGYVDGIALAAYATDEASGSIASFSDGADNVPVKSLIAQINPVQNLNGYDNPWPAGGGKNKLQPADVNYPITVQGVTWTKNADGSITATRSSASSNNSDLSFATFTLSAGDYVFSAPTSGSSGSTFQANIQIAGVSHWGASEYSFTLTEDTAIVVVLRYYSAYSGTARFEPMIRLSTESDATFAPYSNECPISGWTGAEITTNSGNFLPPISAEETYNGVTFSPLANGSTRIHGTASGVASQTFTGNWVSDGLPKYVLYTPTASNVSWYLWDITAGAMIGSQVADLTGYQFTAPKGHSVNLCIRVASGASVDVTFIPAFGVSADVTPNPYVSNEVDVNWQTEAGEVYGGTLGAVSGVLTVTHDVFNFSSSSGWTYRGDGIFSRVITGRVYVRDVAAVWCNEYPVYTVTGYTSAVADAFSIFSGASVNDAMYVRPAGGTLTSLEELNTWLSANPLQVVWQRLSASQTYQLTAQQITSLLGQNNVWSDTGDVEVEYRADTKLYIDKVVG